MSLRDAILGKTEADFRAATARIAPHAIVTPLLAAPAPDGREIRIKCENLQPGGSFKIRCAANIVEQLPDELASRGLVTASAGNFAPAVAQVGTARGFRLTCHVPANTAAVKLAALERLGVAVVPHAFPDWWRIMETRDAGDPDALFLHPVCEEHGITGNGTIALELVEQWPQVDTVIVPFGGGGMISGIAAAMRAVRAGTKVLACEIDAAAPLAAAFAADHPVPFERSATFANGAGTQSVLDIMWPLLRELVDGVVVVSEAEALAAFRTLALDCHLIVEAQSAIAYAAARSPRLAGRNVAAILSGGNIDPAALLANLSA
jgi:threonine dehydratase